MSRNLSGYQIADIAYKFHELPHLNSSLENTHNSTFDYENRQYQESLIVLIAIPIALLIIILFLYLIYAIILCCICCTSNISYEKRDKVIDRKACKLFVIIFSIVTILTFIVGFYGNVRVKSAYNSIENSAVDAIDLFEYIKNTTNEVENFFTFQQSLNNMTDVLESIPQIPGSDINTTQLLNELKTVSDSIGNANQKVNETNKELINLDFKYIIKDIEDFEHYTWFAILLVLCILAIISLLFIFSICLRCLLVFMNMFGIISLILIMIIMGIGLGICVGASDFCVNAKPYIKYLIENNAGINSSISQYYIDCSPGVDSILNDLLGKALVEIDEARVTMDQFEIGINKLNQTMNGYIDQYCINSSTANSSTCKQMIESKQNIEIQVVPNLNEVETRSKEILDMVSVIIEEIRCERINNDINDCLTGICYYFIEGMYFILINAITASLCFTLLVFSSAYTST